jgi:hypothetical protein
VICVEGLICAVRACDIKDNELQRASQKIPSTHKLAYGRVSIWTRVVDAQREDILDKKTGSCLTGVRKIAPSYCE